VDEYARRHGYTPDDHPAARLRWNPGDWAYLLEGGERRFGEVERLLY